MERGESCLRRWTLKQPLEFEGREPLRRWTFERSLILEKRRKSRLGVGPCNDLLKFERREFLRRWTFERSLFWWNEEVYELVLFGFGSIIFNPFLEITCDANDRLKLILHWWKEFTTQTIGRNLFKQWLSEITTQTIGWNSFKQWLSEITTQMISWILF